MLMMMMVFQRYIYIWHDFHVGVEVTIYHASFLYFLFINCLELQIRYTRLLNHNRLIIIDI